MRLDVLSEDSPILDTARRSMLGNLHGAWVMRALFSWEELLARAEGKAFDIALVHVLFPSPRLSGRGGVRFLERAEEVSGTAILVPILPRSKRSSSSLTYIDPNRFPIVLMEGTDDHPQVILRALARASVLQRARTLLSVSPGAHDPRMREAAISFVAHWPPAGSLGQLASLRNVSLRTLRRHCSRGDLPTPRHLFRWGRLLEAFALWEMGAGTRERIAYILGVGGASTLNHLARDLLGRSLDQIMQPGRGDDLHREFFQSLVG